MAIKTWWGQASTYLGRNLPPLIGMGLMYLPKLGSHVPMPTGAPVYVIRDGFTLFILRFSRELGNHVYFINLRKRNVSCKVLDFRFLFFIEIGIYCSYGRLPSYNWC